MSERSASVGVRSDAGAQLALTYQPAPVPPRICNDPQTPEERARRLVDEHPELYALFERFALEALRAGRKRIGARMIAERIRWETTVRMGSDLKVDNNAVPALARRFVERHPEHAQCFEFRGRG